MRTFVCFLVVFWGATAAGAAQNIIRVSSIIPAAEIAESALLLPGRTDTTGCVYTKKYGPDGVRLCCRRAAGLPSSESAPAKARVVVHP